jgi:CAAX prenyl protease N-terminal, five membrane helices
MAATSIPFAYYRTFAIEARFGFNRTTRTLFVVDFVKSCFLGIAFLTPLVLGIDFAMRELGSNWWVLAWGLWVAFNLLAMLLVPTFIMPLFNRFESFELKTRIEALMALRLQIEGRLQDGWQQALEPRQCLLHRPWIVEAYRAYEAVGADEEWATKQGIDWSSAAIRLVRIS